MGNIAKITSKGQTTIPAEIRADLGVGPGDRVEYVKLPDGQIVVRKAKSGLESLRGIIKVDRAYSTEDIVAMVRQMRDGTGWLDDRN
jgi:antitoxin PrlF